MNKYFTEFPKSSAEEWKAKLLSDLKGKPHELLEINDPIEELQLDGYVHNESTPTNQELPGTGSFLRGKLSSDNSWNNGVFIEVLDEVAANKKALQVLMSGADLLLFKSCKPSTNWTTVLEGIELPYIHVQFEPNSLEDYRSIRSVIENSTANITFCIDFIADWDLTALSEISRDSNQAKQPFCLVNGSGIERIGGTSWQEIAFSLNSGHEYLLKLMESGLTIDQAAACISFRIGIGSNFFFSVAKIRALRKLWSTLINAYVPTKEVSKYCSITALIGHTNKSLKDPHTNLLRQSTEAMAALAAGVDSIIVLPHDYYSSEGTSTLSERMAINIPLVLKEESYFDKVIDPMGGSYSLETITEKMVDKAWAKFQEIEKNGGLLVEKARTSLINELNQKRSERIEQLTEGKQKLIGITIFMNPETVDAHWKPVPGYLGVDALILEQHSNTAQ